MPDRTDDEGSRDHLQHKHGGHYIHKAMLIPEYKSTRVAEYGGRLIKRVEDRVTEMGR